MRGGFRFEVEGGGVWDGRGRRYGGVLCYWDGVIDLTACWNVELTYFLLIKLLDFFGDAVCD